MILSRSACAAAAICCFAAVAFIYLPAVSSQPYAYDEADYRWAGQQGFWANYTSAHAIPFVDFVRKGLELSRGSGQRQSFSEFIRSSGDIDFYRHYHGPMYAYWLALARGSGARAENAFRASGLAIQFASATAILLGFWTLFPSLPPVGGLIACALFVFNRSALTGATIITPHALFTFLCIATLLAFSLFLRSLSTAWFYATMALLACSFCTVETSILLVAALGLSVLVEHRRLREKWPTLKSMAGLAVRGTGVFFLTILVCWPMGILQLGIAKGFLEQAYIAIYRKTFSPLGPLSLWVAEFRASPGEFPLLMIGGAAAFLLWRRLPERNQLLPWLAFIAGFFIITLKITAPYSYYYAPLTAALAMATGVAAAVFWVRWAWPGRTAIVASVLTVIVAMTIQFHKAVLDSWGAAPYEPVMLRILSEHPVPPGEKLYVPYQLVPPLHFYHPETATVGVDFDFPLDRMAQGVESADAAPIMFCERAICDALERRAPGFATKKTLLGTPGPDGQPLYLIELRRSAGARAGS